jgi:3-phenylpropionate/trans-cinnamate dioxygenase ferredoxin subunit
MGTVKICAARELELGKARQFVIGDEKICVVRCRDGVRAIDDTCSHEDYSLCEGEVDVDACEIECAKHGSMFSLLTGEPTTFPATQPVRCYPVTERDGDLYVELP